MKMSRLCSILTASAVAVCTLLPLSAFADGEIAHDASRDVQTEGVGNPFNYGERNTPEDASTAEIRAINHKMTVQEVKYALYKEVDEHWDLISTRFGQPEREKVYALMLGLGTRESTLGGNGDGADIETAFSQGFGVSSAHAYGTMQTAVTAFEGCDPKFMKEDNVPEMFQYTLSESTFYDAIISNHMGIRKLLHFVEIGINEEGLTGYQVVRGALKGFNTGWCDYTGDNDGYYKDYPDEIAALAHYYYDEGHLYDNVFSWTNDQKIAPYRENAWDWWGGVEPSMAEPQITVTEPHVVTEIQKGDVNADGEVNVADLVFMQNYILTKETFTEEQFKTADMDDSDSVDCMDVVLLRQVLLNK